MTKICGFVLLACCAVWAQEPGQMGLKSFFAPEYPIVAWHARIQGEVRLSVTVASDGKVISVDSSSGPDILVAYAKSNVVRWAYTGVGRSIKLNVLYTYRLEKPETERAPAPRIELESPVHVIVTSNLPRVTG